MVDQPNAPAAVPVPREAPAARPSVSDEIERWFHDSFHGTSIGGDTENWNLLHAAKEDLKKRLAKFA